METLRDLINHNTSFSKVKMILEVFDEFFGEELVDIQGFDNNSNSGFILVHFPKVRITNEYDRFVDITHLYAKVVITKDGTMQGKFALNRSEYPLLHLLSNYMHSHVHSIPTGNFREFQIPCTGSGPINGTIAGLNRDFDIDIWKLFCLELSKYVTVESISGVPYHRLEEIRGTAYCLDQTLFTVNHNPIYSSPISPSMWASFTLYLLRKDILPINYTNGCYSVADSNARTIIKISNAFIEWINEAFRINLCGIRGSYNRESLIADLVRKGVVYQCIFADNQFWKNGNEYLTRESCLSYEGREICTFKGEPVTIHLIDIDEDAPRNEIYILKPQIVSCILTKILNVINVYYGNTKNKSLTGKKRRVI